MADAVKTFPVARDTVELEQGHFFTPRFDGNGLIPAIVTDAGSGEVLMFAWAKGVTDRPESTFYVMTGLAVVSIVFLSIAVAHIHAAEHHGDM